MSSTRPSARRNLEQYGMVDSSRSLEAGELDDEPQAAPTRKRTRASNVDGDFSQLDWHSDGDEQPMNKRQQLVAVRQSGRSTKHQGNMAETSIDEEVLVEQEPVEHIAAQPTKIVEMFTNLPEDEAFVSRHTTVCEACGQDDTDQPFICCQGCNFSYHQSCIGTSNSRQHAVTRIAQDRWLLQCKRCVGVSHKRDALAPDLGKCVVCGEHGQGCKAKQQWANIDEFTQTSSTPSTSAEDVLARCWSCFRAWHFDHLPENIDDAHGRWRCAECVDMPSKIASIVAWKPADPSSYQDDFEYSLLEEAEKIYLIKWKDIPYTASTWMPGAWVWSVGAAATRKAFAKSENAQQPMYSIEEAVPESYMQADLILDVLYKDESTDTTIDSINHALVKYKGLGYEDIAWDQPPTPEHRHAAFDEAFNNFCYGLEMRQPRPIDVRSRLSAMRRRPFDEYVREEQPGLLTGGKLMGYQLDGLNWLCHQHHAKRDVILGDEMGLGKTIQIIAFIAALVQDFECFPHLVVVPNSTCENWRREFKRWAPGLRVVAYHGSKKAREMSHAYELFPQSCRDMRCHVLITSYETATKPDDQGRQFFHEMPWQSLVVDEGQRLKNDSSLLYKSLSRVKVPFKVLLTGTPLQNNQRELFNLLHFIDRNIDVEAYEEQYSTLDESKIRELHDKLRPHFLRRTKAEVLGFLPPMSQVILPLSMPFRQKELYRDLLDSSPQLRKLLMSKTVKPKSTESLNLNNILMQLRKCLCHPDMCSEDTDQYADHQLLVQSSSKLVLLEKLLPKLRAGGHRVLMFSQFLGMLDILEDFLRGMNMSYQRLDGNISGLEKQKRLDMFNSPDSELFVFLLSTRAGGVGINLSTADTVIMLDPDFNPHQDLQALSRAHRIGQTKKVLCLQLITKDTVEERIMQIGRKKLALDKILIHDIDEETPPKEDMLSILRHGAAKLISDPEGAGSDVQYDDAALDALLDRSKIEVAPPDQNVKNLWSFAQVWSKDGTAHREDVVNYKEQQAPSSMTGWADHHAPSTKRASQQAGELDTVLGRGRRARQSVNYFAEQDGDGDGAAKTIDHDQSDGDFRQSDADDSDVQLPKGRKLGTTTPVVRPPVSAKTQKGRNVSAGMKPVVGGWATKVTQPRARKKKDAVGEIPEKTSKKPLKATKASDTVTTSVAGKATPNEPPAKAISDVVSA